MAAQNAAQLAQEHGVRSVDVKVKGPGAGRESAIRALRRVRLDIKSIKDVTPSRTTAAARRSGAASDSSQLRQVTACSCGRMRQRAMVRRVRTTGGQWLVTPIPSAGFAGVRA